MLFPYALLFFALISSTSVLAAPTPPNGQLDKIPNSVQGGLESLNDKVVALQARRSKLPPLGDPSDNPSKPLLAVKQLLKGDWFRMPMPDNLNRPPVRAIHSTLHSRDMLSFGSIGNFFVCYYGLGAHVDYEPSLVGGKEPYVTKESVIAQQRSFIVGQQLTNPPTILSLLVGYWRSANSGTYMRITVDSTGRLFTRRLTEDEVGWTKEELARSEKEGKGEGEESARGVVLRW